MIEKQMWKTKLILGILCGWMFFSCSPAGGGQDTEMNAFVTGLMKNWGS